MLWSLLRTRTVERLAEYTAGAAEAAANASFSDATIFARMSEAYRELIGEVADIEPSKVLSLSTNTTYAANSESISLPTAVTGRPVYGVQRLFGTEWQTLKELTHDQVQRILAGESDYENQYAGYMLEKQTLVYLVPKPTSVETLRFRYIEEIADIATSDTGSPTLLPSEHHPLIALATALKFKREVGSMPALQEEYVYLLNRMRTWAASSPTTGPRFVRET